VPRRLRLPKGCPPTTTSKALSAGLWSHYPAAPFTDILDVMRGTGFIGVRLTGFPTILKTYDRKPGIFYPVHGDIPF
jgi:hypothetical protein